MAATSRDELASLKIERRGPYRQDQVPGRSAGRRLGPGLMWLIPLGLLSGAGAFGYRHYEKLRPKLEVSIVAVQMMTPGEAEKLLSAKGYLKSRHQARIGIKTPGRLATMGVEEGSRVKKGQVLAVLEHDDLKAQLQSRRAQIERAEAELREARLELKDKVRKVRRQSRIFARSYSSAEDFEAVESARDIAVSRVEAMEASIRMMKSSEEEVEETIRAMHIIAPFDGTVVTKAAEVGETITLLGTGSVVTLADLDRIEVETDIPEGLLSQVRPGQPAEISVSAVPGRRYRGKLRQVIPMGDRARGTVKVEVQILDPDEHLFPELVATVHFLPGESASRSDAGRTLLFVPKEAIVEEGGQSFVWTVDDELAVHRRRIEAVITHDELARVESGLKGSEKVLLKPPRTMRENQSVKEAE